MNSKTLQYNETAHSAIEIPALPRNSAFIVLVRSVIGWFTRSELEQARAHFRTRRERTAQNGSTPDIVNSLSLEQRHQFGLYRHMD